ncbi:MAG: reactive intermediate/imine deaminase [Flavobacteriales bacterium]|nr:reactive intermediate/imine deaminase [Flavobacteriales bacterium]|tara:strand:- start:38916 stop:39299 length:384 start_codon:yes stop_codon:yes gene_type:complete
MKKIIETKEAPAPIGAYNQAVLTNGTLYVSGQIALDTESGELITSDIQSEAKKVMENLKAVLKAADMNFSNVVKASIFLSDMENFSAVNEIYSSYFNHDTAPARECVQVAALPKYVNVEISVIAVES